MRRITFYTQLAVESIRIATLRNSRMNNYIIIKFFTHQWIHLKKKNKKSSNVLFKKNTYVYVSYKCICNHTSMNCALRALRLHD